MREQNKAEVQNAGRLMVSLSPWNILRNIDLAQFLNSW